MAHMRFVFLSLAESITEANDSATASSRPATCHATEPLVELETEKVTVEVPAPASGVLVGDSW